MALRRRPGNRGTGVLEIGKLVAPSSLAKLDAVNDCWTLSTLPPASRRAAIFRQSLLSEERVLDRGSMIVVQLARADITTEVPDAEQRRSDHSQDDRHEAYAQVDAKLEALLRLPGKSSQIGSPAILQTRQNLTAPCISVAMATDPRAIGRPRPGVKAAGGRG